MILDPAVRLLLAALTVYRLSQLLALDDGPGAVFKRLRAWAGIHPVDVIRSNLGELLRCPFCLGVWFAMGAVVLVIWPTLIGDLFLLVWGLAGVQAFLEGFSHGER